MADVLFREGNRSRRFIPGCIDDPVFTEETPGLATLHPHGRSRVGDLYDDKYLYDIGPRPIINLELNYEETRFRIDAEDVRNAYTLRKY